jgi:hypothetical protein
LCVRDGNPLRSGLMTEHGKDIREVISDMAKRKKRAAEARFGGNASSEEVPRDVYLAGCKEIANALGQDDYIYAKSGPKLYRKYRDFTFQISFQSSRDNIPGELVALWIHGNVFSPTLKKWRMVNPCLLEGSGGVAGGQIGNLAPRHSWMEWNLANPCERCEQIADAVATIKRIVYPFFAMFDDIPGLVRRLVNEDIPTFGPSNVLDFLMCFGSRSDAQQAARGMFQSLPEARERYPAALSRFRAEGLPPYILTIHGEVLAAATIIYGFPDLAHETG